MTDGGDLSVTTTAAYSGTYGMQALINDNGSIYVTDWGPSEEKHYRARFYFDPNSITMGSSDSHDVFVGYNRSNTDIFRIDFAYYNPGNYGVRAIARLDSPMYRTTLYSVIDDSPHAIELEWVAATSAGVNDGVIKLWIDGVEKTSLQDLDNDTHQIDYVRFGAVSGIDTGTRGTYYFDAFESTRESYIGPLASRQGATVAKTGEVNRLGSLFLAIKNFVQAIWKPALFEHNDPDFVVIALAPEKAPAIPAHNEGLAAGSAASLGLLGAGDIFTTTITYSYDALSRLTDADYSSGEFFDYTYDAVGNRLSEITASGTTTYTYDTANRLAYVNGDAYSWDDNGNLLSDGVYTYTYSSANRLIEVDWQEGTASYAYNGQGDRLQQTIGITTTNYTLDLAAGLTQVLDDGEFTYLYGNGRIAQSDAAGVQYFLGDALGSVRQIVDSSGEVLLARSYEPYGEVLASAGEGNSSYGFTGEMQDATGLVYLRARYYAPRNGRFLTRDTWQGNALMPMSLNRWNYTNANPINFSDPSGHFPPIWCQTMPNKGLYEVCVDLHYGIEPINPLEPGKEVTGSQGCYHGPKAYRAPGYIEGTGLTIAAPSIVNWLFAAESVYDFASMEHNYFFNGSFGLLGIPGVGVSDFLWGFTATEYAGYVYGLKSNSSINDDYPGPFVVGYIGASLGQEVIDLLGLTVGIGKTGFFSPYDPIIRGSSTYIVFGFGLDPLPIVDVGIGVISTMPVASPISYLKASNANKVNRMELFRDIMLGKHNVWVTRLGLSYFSPIDWASRISAAGQAMRYAGVYEELHDENN